MSDTPTDAGSIDEGWVRQATRLVGLQITPAQMPGVLAWRPRSA